MPAPRRAGPWCATWATARACARCRRAQRREHDGIHRGGRPADGNALRRARPRRDALPHRRAQHGRARNREADLQQSGLLGVSGISSDMRKLLAQTIRGQSSRWTSSLSHRARARLARRGARWTRCDRLHGGHRRELRRIRERVCRDAAWLGVELDPRRTQRAARASARRQPRAAWVIPTNEELMIARHTQRLLARSTTQTAVRVLRMSCCWGWGQEKPTIR